MRPRRGVLLAVDSLVGGGAEQHVVDVAVGLAERGWGVRIACSVPGPPGEQVDATVELLRDHGVGVHPLMARLVKRRASRRYAARLRDLLAERPADLVHAHIFASAAAAGTATSVRRLPLVVTEHTEGPWRDARTRRQSVTCYRRADLILAVSRAIASLLREDYRVPADKVRLMVPVGRPQPVTGAVAGREPEERAGGPPTVGFVGRLCQEKGVDVLLRAMPRVLARCPDARLVVVGDGPERDALRALAHTPRLRERVQFLGHRDDVASLLPTFDVLAVPSRSDGAPLVVHEAMQAGVAVVGSAVGGIPDRLADGRCGELVAPGQVRPLAEAISALLRDPVRRDRLARAGRELAERTTFDGMVATVEQTYDDALARPGAPLRPAVPEPPPGRRREPVGT